MAEALAVAPPEGFQVIPPPPEGFEMGGAQNEPDLASGNKALARSVGNAMKPALTTVQDIGSVYAPIETALNATTGLLFGFPAYIGGAIGGLADKYLLGRDDVDPKQMAETISKVFTYIPYSERGKRLTGNAMMPLALLQEGAEATGQAVSRTGTAVGLPTDVAAGAGAITDASIQMLPAVLLGSLTRRMAGKVPATEDFADTAKVIAGEGATPADVANVEHGLRATYEATGIDPISGAEDAKAHPEVASEIKGYWQGRGGTQDIEATTEVPGILERLSKNINEDRYWSAVPPVYRKFAPETEGLPAESTEGTPPVEAPSGQPDGQPMLDVSGQTVEERRAEGTGETTDMNMGVSPAAAVKAFGESYTPYVGLEAPFNDAPSGGLVDSLLKVIAPAARGPIAEQQAGIMRANAGKMAREREVALENLKGFAADFDKAPVEQNQKFIGAMEHGAGREGAKLEDPKQQAAAQAIGALLDQKRTEVQALGNGQLENFIQNYFPHIWKDESAAQAFYARRPLAGSGAFLKERTYDSFKEGIDAGLTPVTDNPVELALLKAREMDRYIYGQNVFAEMKDTGLAKFVRFGEKAPNGWTKINDKIARVFQYSEDEKGMIIRGEYYAPDEAATLINNHLSPGLQGNGVFDAYRRIGMMMNTAQLGLSAFHVGFTTLDSMVSKVALGVKQMARGDIAEGAANVALGVSPTQPFSNLYKGDRLMRAYLGRLDDPDLAPIVDAIQEAGGRVKMDDFYRNATVNAFKQAIRSGDRAGMAKELLPTILDRVNAPIFEYLVPRQKLGVYFDMAKDWLAQNPEATVAERRAGLGKLWDSVDNRMGQLVYDNVFWNRALKDSLLATVRSVGWNLGTFRELGGGVADAAKTLVGGEFTDRTAYVIALPILAGIYGAITQYLYTGEAPREAKDLYFPRTGRIRPDGSEDRVSLPTYMKDVYAYGEDVSSFAKYGTNPLTTLQNKAHPMVSTVAQMLNNEDFYGAAIRNPSAPVVQQMLDEAGYLTKQIEPFSLRNYQQQTKLKGNEPGVADYLTSPSMVGVVPAPGYITKSDEQKESEQVSKLRDPLMRKFRQQLKDGTDADDLVANMEKAGLSKQDIKYVLRSASDQPRARRLKSFGKDENE